ncbi:MAG: nickel pincer cofactor biosynthesis protein LarC [Verrucomicrobiota bacterium]|jgi:uncharacterized protein (TIGR00299 family) protein|nr:nickel pincer cofactor biosynthesis protein LarC [Verrucomicrobiota bacterium]
MKTFLRFDSVGGASGDMILAALAALGADLAAVEKRLGEFFPEPLHIHADPAGASGLHGLRVSVHAAHHPHPHEEVWPDAHGHEHGHGHSHGHEHAHGHGHGEGHAHAHRGLAEIAQLLNASPLAAATRELALAVFRALAEAEAKIHGKTPETVHFHEVGAWDSVADIVGACLALEQLGVCGVSCGPLPSGVGTLRCAHGEMPNPAPATLELLAGMAVTQTDEPHELVTPTGAALLRVWTRTLAPVPAETTVIRSAFGFGGRALNGRPNVLRATLLSESAPARPPAGDLAVLETNLDDCNPEWIGALTADLLERGALDVWHTPAVMKKGRPGFVLSVLAEPGDAAALRDRLFRATTTFGIRSHAVQRETLARRFEQADTPWGSVPVKVGSLNGEDITFSPEHDACAALALANRLAPRQVYEAAKSQTAHLQSSTAHRQSQ